MKQSPNKFVILLSVGSIVSWGQLIGRLSWSMWFYLTMIMLSIVAASLVTFRFTGIIARPVIAMWFLLVCPGMTVVRFFQLHETVIEWVLALALSIAIDAFIAGILLYAGWWSPSSIFMILIIFCLIGALLQFIKIGLKIHLLRLERDSYAE